VNFRKKPSQNKPLFTTLNPKIPRKFSKKKLANQQLAISKSEIRQSVIRCLSVKNLYNTINSEIQQKAQPKSTPFRNA
jgi:hypothetical protein